MGKSRYVHRDTKHFTRKFPAGFVATPIESSGRGSINCRTLSGCAGRSHWQIKTPLGTLQWWPSRGRWQMPGSRTTDIGTERDLLEALNEIQARPLSTKGGEDA